MGYQRRVHGDSSGDSPLVSTHRLELTLDGQYWIGKDASRPVHTKRWPHPQGKVLVQLCLSIEGIPGPPCPRGEDASLVSPQHCRNSARDFPRPQARVLQAGVPDVRQAKAPRPHPPDPRSARRPRPHLHHRILLLPSPHRDLRNLQGKRKAILKYFMKKPNKTFLLLPSALKKKNEKIQAVLSNISLYINYTKSARIKWITNQF